MRVSFIIPLYNCLAHTRECVRTLQASLPLNLSHEIILVDDGSTDGTREWLATLAAPFHVILNERNRGYAAANNRAAALARGDLLVFLNNDLILAPRWLEPMLAVHRRLPSPGLVGNVQVNARTGALDHAGIFFNAKGKPEHDRHFPLPAALFCGYRPVPALTGACFLVAASLWRELRGFDDNYLNGGEDIDLCFRAGLAGRTNAVALRSRVRHHVSASPGRKLRDEENSRRLTLRWRQEITRLAAPAWCRQYLTKEWGLARDPSDHALALGALAYLLRLRRRPPLLVSRGVESALQAEIARWQHLFG
jgi:GT2 family glycosyltransferase